MTLNADPAMALIRPTHSSESMADRGAARLCSCSGWRKGRATAAGFHLDAGMSFWSHGKQGAVCRSVGQDGRTAGCGSIGDESGGWIDRRGTIGRPGVVNDFDMARLSHA